MAGRDTWRHPVFALEEWSSMLRAAPSGEVAHESAVSLVLSVIDPNTIDGQCCASEV